MLLLKSENPYTKMWIDMIKDKILEFVFEQTDKGDLEASLTLDNSDFSLMDTDLILRVDDLIIQYGEKGNLSPKYKVNFKKVTGLEKIVFKGGSVLWKNDEKPIKWLWEDKGYGDIVREIAKEMGYNNPDIKEPDLKEPSIQQYETNSQFLSRLAKRIGYSFWIDAENLHFKPRSVKDKVSLTLVYRGYSEKSQNEMGLIIGEPRVSIEFSRKKVSKIRGKSIIKKVKRCADKQKNPIAKLTASVLCSQSFRFVNGILASSLNLVAPKTEESIVVNKLQTYAEKLALDSKQESVVYAPSGKSKRLSFAYNKTFDKVKIEVTIRGRADLKIADTVEIYGIGGMLEGKYYVKKIFNKIDGNGFTQELELVRNSIKKKHKNTKKHLNGKTTNNSVKGAVNNSKQKLDKEDKFWDEYLVNPNAGMDSDFDIFKSHKK